MHPEHTVVLTIDDESSVRQSVKAYLEDYDYHVLEASDSAEGIRLCTEERVDLVLLDVRMPGMSGLEVLQVLRDKCKDIPVIMISGAGNVDDVVKALRLGARDYLTKPIIDMTILRHAVVKALEHVRLERENKEYQERLESKVTEKTGEFESLNQRLRKVVESTRKFFGCGDLLESGEMILEEFGDHMKAAGGSLYMVTATSLRLVSHIGENSPPSELVFPLKHTSVFGFVFETGEPTIVENITEVDHLEPCGGTGYADTSFAVFPIVDHQAQIQALLALHNKQVSPFKPQDREIGAVLASCASEALQTAGAFKALKKSEELMLQAQKREAIATLAGGIAHDFNNILSAIVGYADLGLYCDDCNDKVRENFSQIKKAGHRARDLVRQILSLSRADNTKESSVDLAHTVLEALDFVRATLPSSISIEHKVQPGHGNIEADPSRIHQVIMNLCTNAAHAMQIKGGLLQVTYGKVEVAKEPFNLYELKDETCLKLAIRDTGTGMKPDLLEKIFDPYFTTKGKGEGTGLGLAVVQGIIGSVGGAIRVVSQYEKGSTFYIYFPIASATDEKMPRQSDIVMLPGDERILFVDDEETIGEMAKQMLTHLGYKVTTYSDSVESLKHFTEDPSAYDLVITDLTMPNMSGVDLARAMSRVNPAIPIILHTGYSTMVDAGEARDAGVTGFMIKPLSMVKLARQIREVLDGQVGD